MSKQPNILWLVSDATRFDHLSCYGYNRRTPHIDALAASATLYETALAPSSWSLPSYTSFLTGLYPSQHGLNAIGLKLDENIPTLPERLERDHACITACFTANPYISDDFGTRRGFSEYQLMGTPVGVLRLEGKLTGRRKLSYYFRRITQYLGLRDQGAAAVVQRACDFFRTASSPWFAKVVLLDAHGPYAPPLRWWLRSCKNPGEVFSHLAFAKRTGNLYRFREALGDDPQAWERLIRLYDAEIAYADYRIGQLLNWLKRRGLYDDTLIIFCADHGETMGERGRIEHSCLGNTLAQVPLIIKEPGQTAGRRVGGVVEVIQAAQKLMAGEFAPFQLEPAEFGICQYVGKSDPLWERDPLRRGLYEQWKLRDDITLLRTPEWELITYEDGTRELYDIIRDPRETTDLALQEPEVVNRLQYLLDARLEEIGGNGDEELEYAEVSPEVEQRLQDLGYI